jgi:hypothetical protein
MADDKQRLIDFIKAYQSIAPETAGINPYEVGTKEDFMQIVEGMKPDVRERAMRDANRYKYVLPEDYEYPGISPQDRADSYGVVGGDNPFTKNPTRRKQNIIDMIERGEMSALDYNLPGMRAEGQVTDKAAQKINPYFKAGILEEMYSNRDKMSQGPRYKTLSEGKTPSYMLNEDGSKKTSKEISKETKKEEEYKGPFPKKKPTIKKETKKETKKEAEKFVPKDTVLGRIFDKRVRPGEEISNLAKTNAMLRNISDNLLERRVVGGKEGTSTLSRILGPGGGIREGFDEIEALETASESKKAAAVDRALALRKKQLDYDTGLANIAKTYYDMSGNADATTLQKNAEYAAQMAVSSGQIGADETAAFISQYLRLDQIGANVLASQLESLQEQLFTADPDEQEAIKQQIADINNQIQIRGSGQSTGITENVIPYKPGATQ